MKFTKYDEVEHPIYGRGIVRKIIDSKSFCPVLDVEFDQGGFHKRLNAKWVSDNCICYADMSDEELSKKYTPFQLPDLPNWKIEVNKGAAINEQTQNNLLYLLNNTTPGIGFAIIGENSAVAFFPDEDKGYKSIEKVARRYMSSVFTKHPDFWGRPLDDEGAVIFMNDDRLIHYLRPEDTLFENGKLSGKTMFSSRERLMEACLHKKIWAIVKGY